MILFRNTAFLCSIVLGLAGCSIAPVDPTFISTTPADAKSFSVAKRAVNACRDLTSSDLVRRRFERAGFGVSSELASKRNGRIVKRTTISSPDEKVYVLFLGHACYVGLENMTPEQSKQLAQIWANAHNAKPNSAYGDGLSDHVSGAWRRFVEEPYRIPDKAAFSHRIYIAAYKTWPYGPYDPQQHVSYPIADFPKKPGAAVKIVHHIECHSIVETSPTSGVFLSCSRPDYRPK